MANPNETSPAGKVMDFAEIAESLKKVDSSVRRRVLAELCRQELPACFDPANPGDYRSEEFRKFSNNLRKVREFIGG